MLAGAPRNPGVILLFWGKLLEGSTPSPKPKGSWAVPVYDPMIRVTISPITEGPCKPPSQEWYQGSTGGQASPWTLVFTGTPPRFPFPQPQLHFRTKMCCSPILVLPVASYPSAKSIQTCLPCNHIMCNIPLWKKSHISRQNSLIFFLSFSLSPSLSLLVLFNWSDSTNWVMRINPAFITL